MLGFRLYSDKDIVVFEESIEEDELPAAAPVVDPVIIYNPTPTPTPIPSVEPEQVPVVFLTNQGASLEYYVDDYQATYEYTVYFLKNGVVEKTVVLASGVRAFEWAIDEDGSYTVYVEGKMAKGGVLTSEPLICLVSSEGVMVSVDADMDYDGLSDEMEAIIGSDPNKGDSDDDGLIDGYEYYVLGYSPIDKDSDFDGIEDSMEDDDHDGLTVLEEYTIGTDQEDKDTENDGLLDGEEVKTYGTNPLLTDSDGDGISDYDEIQMGKNPLLEDSDGDGILDGEDLVFQSLAVENFQASVFEANTALPYIGGEAADYVNGRVIVREYSGDGLAHTRAIIGKPLEVLQLDGKPLTLGFNLNPLLEKKLVVEGTSYDKLFIVSVVDGEFVFHGSVIDEGLSTIEASITEDGIYFVLDAEQFYFEIGLSLEEMLVKEDEEDEDDVDADKFDAGDLDVDARFMPAMMSPAMMSLEADFEEVEDVIPADILESTDNNVQGVEEVMSLTDVTPMLMAMDMSPMDVVTPFREVEGPGVETEEKVYAPADIVFIIDTTGSMSGEISSVKSTITQFVDELKNRGIIANLALVDYKDITSDGLDSTVVHMNGGSSWFMDTQDYKDEISSLRVSGGGDRPESVVDALEEARNLDMRVGAAKFFVLVTDVDYKEENRFGIEGMDEEIELLKKDGIYNYVATSTYYSSTYADLYGETGGAFVNLYGSDFYTELVKMIDRIGEIVVDDGQ